MITMTQPLLTYIGGPTLLIEIGKVRFLSDPTFDPAGSRYMAGRVQLEKTTDPATGPDSLSAVDAVLLTHDQHNDNLDETGRRISNARRACLLRFLGRAVSAGTHSGWLLGPPVSSSRRMGRNR